MASDNLHPHLTTTVAAGAGGFLWAMAKLFAVVFAPVQPSNRDVARACVESIFAIIAAVIGGWFVAPYLVRKWGVTDTETISLIALAVGLSFWQSIPLLTGLILKWLPDGVSKHFGVITHPQSQEKTDAKPS